MKDLARNQVNLNKGITHRPDMLKAAGSLDTDQVRAHHLPRMSGREGRPTPLGAALAEHGRSAETEHLLHEADPADDTCCRQMNRQLTMQEPRHKLARDVCHGKRGTNHQTYRNGTEDQPGTLSPALNPIMLCTTRNTDTAVAQLKTQGHEIPDEDIPRLSLPPPKHPNPNLPSRYNFTASTPAAGALPPLRDPEASELDEHDDNGQE